MIISDPRKIENLLQKITITKQNKLELTSRINKHISEIETHGVENIEPDLIKTFDLPLINKQDSHKVLEELNKDKTVNKWFLKHVD